MNLKYAGNWCLAIVILWEGLFHGAQKPSWLPAGRRAACEEDWWSVCFQSEGWTRWERGNLGGGCEKRQRFCHHWPRYVFEGRCCKATLWFLNCTINCVLIMSFIVLLCPSVMTFCSVCVIVIQLCFGFRC